jgi:hypothetical protein
MTSYYGFTIKCIKHGVSTESSQLEDIMRKLIARHKAIYVDHFVEYDSLQRAHIHGTFMARKGLLLSLFKVPYYHIHLDYLKTLSDVENWSQYIRSDQGEDKGLKQFLKDIQSEYLFI